MATTLEVIRPVITRVYGAGQMAARLAAHLAEKIDSGDMRCGLGRYESREDMIVSVCWDWMPGGGTAQLVGREIEAALNAHGIADLGGPPYPGSDAALEAGCICPVLDNGHGDTGLARDRGGWVIIVGCPIHVPAPDDTETR